jgi:hypothetical protein
MTKQKAIYWAVQYIKYYHKNGVSNYDTVKTRIVKAITPETARKRVENSWLRGDLYQEITQVVPSIIN